MTVVDFRVKASQAELYDIGEGVAKLVALAGDAELPQPCMSMLLALDEAVTAALASAPQDGHRWRRALHGPYRYDLSA